MAVGVIAAAVPASSVEVITILASVMVETAATMVEVTMAMPIEVVDM